MSKIHKVKLIKFQNEEEKSEIINMTWGVKINSIIGLIITMLVVITIFAGNLPRGDLGNDSLVRPSELNTFSSLEEIQEYPNDTSSNNY